MVSSTRRHRWLRLVSVVMAMLCALLLVAATASAAETVTTGAAVTASATSPAGATAAAPGAVGVSPASADWQPLNPGMSPAEILVQVWPEYDTTSTEVLVLVNLTVPDSVPLPFTFKYAVPKGARVTGFAMVAPDGNFDYNRPNPQFSSGGSDWDLVTVTVPTYRQIHLEYYYSPGIPASGAKKFSAVFISPADTAAMTFAVQHPLRSTGFSTDPAGADGGTDAEGFAYTTQAFSSVKDGDRARVDVSYTKNDSDPSKASGATTTPAQSQSTRWFLILVAVLVVAVAALVAYRVFSQKKQTAPAVRGRAPRPGAGGEQGTGKAGLSRFCTQCGAKLTKRERFCPQCGHEREG